MPDFNYTSVSLGEHRIQTRRDSTRLHGERDRLQRENGGGSSWESSETDKALEKSRKRDGQTDGIREGIENGKKGEARGSREKDARHGV